MTLTLAFDGEIEALTWYDPVEGRGNLDTKCVRDRHATLRIVRDTQGLTELDAWLRMHAHRALGIDSETNAQHFSHPEYAIRLVQIASATEVWVVVVEQLDHADRAYLTDLIRRHPYWVAQFSEVDLAFIETALPGSFNLDSIEPNIADLQVVNAWYNPRTVVPQQAKDGLDPRIAQAKGLKETSTRELSPVLADVEKAMHAHWHALAPKGHRTPAKYKAWGFANIPNTDPLYLAYSALDPLMTVRLWDKFVAAIKERGQWQQVLRDLRWQWAIDKRTFAGIAVDPPYVRWLDRQLADLVNYNANYLHDYGIKPTGMGPQVGVAFEKLGVPAMKKTPSGAASWDKEVISQLVSRQPARQKVEVPGIAVGGAAPDVVAYADHVDDGEQVRTLAASVKGVRQATKFAAAYVQPMLDALDRDGRVHWSHRVLGTVTSRHSAARPALQQQPKKDTRVRAAYTADPGFVIVSCDLAQGEPRVMAALSGDANLKADIYSGDLNGRIAAAAFGERFIPADGKTAGTASYLMRQGGKAGFLAKCYGGGVGRVDDTVGVPKGTNIGRPWEKRYSRLFEYGAQLGSRASVTLYNGWVVPLWDRFTVLESGELRLYPKPSRKALNYVTQGTQRALLQDCWERLVAMGWGWAAYFFLHDEILLHVPWWMAEQAKAALEEAMTFVFMEMQFECEATIDGRTWLPQPATFEAKELESVDMEGELIDA